jgi:iron-sulfur cluster repair protein YtfE (RIC family)
VNPFTLMEKDHEEAKALFKRFEALGDDAHVTKQEIFDKIKIALSIHMTIEEEIFYPAVKGVRSEEVKDLVREADEEHHVAKLLISEISKMKPTDEHFDAKVTVLKENIEHHIREEEGEMFPDARKKVAKERLEQLGAEMEDRKNELMEKYG